MPTTPSEVCAFHSAAALDALAAHPCTVGEVESAGGARPHPAWGVAAPATLAVMVLEVATLDVRPGHADAFEAAFREARQILVASPGHRRHELRRCVEAPDRYLLLVWWDSLESHTEGFRRSPAYQRWRELLHGFYDPFPSVEHYVAVPGVGD